MINKIIMAENLTKDLELCYLPSDSAIASTVFIPTPIQTMTLELAVEDEIIPF